MATDYIITEDGEDDYVEVATTPMYIVGIILTAVALYVVVALTVHRIKTRKKSKKLQSIKGSVRIAKTENSPGLDNLSLAAAIFCLLNCSGEHPLIYTKEVSNILCKVMQLCNFIFYGSGIMCLYFFLWLRQRACYKNPSLAQMHSKLARIASTVILPVFIVMMVIGMILTGVLWSFEASPNGCLEVNKIRTPLIILYAGSVAMQITLLGLFVYPLKRHTNFMLKRSALRSTDRFLSNLVKRSLITTSLCVLADTVAFVIAMLLPYNLPFIAINYTYDANLLCNVICLIGSFADWRRRIAPWCCYDRIRKPRFTSSRYVSSLKTTNTSSV